MAAARVRAPRLWPAPLADLQGLIDKSLLQATRQAGI